MEAKSKSEAVKAPEPCVLCECADYAGHRDAGGDFTECPCGHAAEIHEAD